MTKLEMCYDGALVMPSNYAVVDEDEMTYLEGGIKFSQHWWGIQMSFNGNETNGLLAAIATGSANAWLGTELSAAGGITLPASVPLGVIAAALAVSAGAISLANWKNKGKGFSINRFWTGQVTIW